MTAALKELLDPAALVVFAIIAVLLVAGWGVWEVFSRRSEAKLRETIAKGVGQSTYQLAHGGKSSYYFDIDGFLADRASVQVIGAWVQDLVEAEREHDNRIECLAFIEKREGPVGALTLKEFLSEMVDLPSITVRLRKRVLGLSFKPYSGSHEVFRSRARILLVSDVATTGGTLQDAIEKIRRAGGRVDIAAVIHDREEKDKDGIQTVDKLRAEGIRMERFSTRSAFVEMFGENIAGPKKKSAEAA